MILYICPDAFLCWVQRLSVRAAHIVMCKQSFPWETEQLTYISGNLSQAHSESPDPDLHVEEGEVTFLLLAFSLSSS